MNILLTGSAGFIGFHTARKLLESGNNVIGIDSINNYYDPSIKASRLKLLKGFDGFKFYRADITDFNALDKIFSENKIDKIIHLAAQAGVRYSIDHPLTYDESNIQGSYVVFELALKHKIRHVVAASSSSVYGKNKKLPFSESDLVEWPVSLYAATKRANELMGFFYSRAYNINITMLRFFTVYGPYGRPDMALFKFTKNILESKPIDVYNYGNMQRDFTYIDDISDGILLSLEKEFAFEIFNLGNSETISLGYFISLIEKILGKKAEKNLLPMQKGDVEKTYADISKAKKLLGYSPKIKVEYGVREFIKWYLSYYNISHKITDESISAEGREKVS